MIKTTIVLSCLLILTFTQQILPTNQDISIVQNDNDTIPFMTVELHHHTNFLLYQYYISSQEKKQTLDEGLPVIHIDSHPDSEIPVNKSPMEELWKTTLEQAKKFNIQKLIEDTEEGDYIPAAQIMGLMGNEILFIHPSWKGISYHYTMGEYKIYLGLRDFTRNKKITQICYKKIPGEVEKDKLLTSYYESRGLGEYASLNYFVSKNIECSKTMKKNLKLITWNVKDIEGVLNGIKGKVPYTDKWHQLFEKKKKFILDMDLDYFATTFALVDEYASIRENVDYFKILSRYFTKDKFCKGKNEHAEEIMTQTLVEMFWGGFSFSGPFKKFKNHPALDLWCDGKKFGLKQMRKISTVFDILKSKLKFEILADLKYSHKFPEVKCSFSGLFGVCQDQGYGDPDKTPSWSNIEKSMKKVVEYLGELRNKYNAVPEVIMVARSNSYTPMRLVYPIEKLLRKSLKELYGDKKFDYQYYGAKKLNESIYLKKSLEKVVDDVTHVIDDVESYSKSKRQDLKQVADGVIQKIKNFEKFMITVKHISPSQFKHSILEEFLEKYN